MSKDNSIWIELHVNLETNPKLYPLMEATRWGKWETIGRLVGLWCWVIRYAEDGDLSKYMPIQYLDHLKGDLSPVELHRFLQDSGWINSDDKIHDWLEYAGLYLIRKYHSSNLKRLKEIWKKHDRVYGRGNHRKQKGNSKVTNSQLLPDLTIPNLTIPKDIQHIPPIIPQKKDKYLDFVMLTKEQYNSLIEKFGQGKAVDYMERLNNYIGSKGNKYKSHYHTILNWERRDGKGKNRENDAELEKYDKMG